MMPNTPDKPGHGIANAHETGQAVAASSTVERSLAGLVFS